MGTLRNSKSLQEVTREFLYLKFFQAFILALIGLMFLCLFLTYKFSIRNAYSFVSSHSAPIRHSKVVKTSPNIWEKTQQIKVKMDQEDQKDSTRVTTLTWKTPAIRSSSSPCELQPAFVGFKTQCKW